MARPRDVLERYRVIAVVGASRSPSKAAHRIPRQMKDAGYRILPVNPYAAELFGEKAYQLLADIPEPVEIVNVFRPSDEAAGVARQAVEIGAKAVWLQLGITSREARRVADDAGLDYVENRCIGVEMVRHGITKVA